MEYIEKGRDRIQISVRSYKGKVYVDIRTFFQTEGGEWRPLPKGVTIPTTKWEEFKEKLDGIDITEVEQEPEIGREQA